jgi:hypothetical protein
MDIAGGVPKVPQSLPKVELSVILPRSCRLSRVTSVTATRQFSCGWDVLVPWAHGFGHRPQSLRARLFSSIGV